MKIQKTHNDLWTKKRVQGAICIARQCTMHMHMIDKVVVTVAVYLHENKVLNLNVVLFSAQHSSLDFCRKNIRSQLTGYEMMLLFSYIHHFLRASAMLKHVINIDRLPV